MEIVAGLYHVNNENKCILDANLITIIWFDIRFLRSSALVSILMCASKVFFLCKISVWCGMEKWIDILDVVDTWDIRIFRPYCQEETN